ncbi:MAG: sce7726 family protein [Pseudomonadota bacterium]|nr:sce7726 family protein [Pseudomonadota bacterium]
MDEAQVKVIVLAHVRAEYGRRQKPIVTPEFSLGSSGVRADLAVFSAVTTGFEIKTAKDSLRRFESQMKAYSRYFDRTVAVVAPAHVRNISDAQLCGAALWTYDEKGALNVLREGIVRKVCEGALIDVLTQAERRKSDFRAAVEARYKATSQQFWQAVAGRSIHPDDLPQLSRFAAIREQAKRHAAERNARWSTWLAAQEVEVEASA